MGEFSGDVYHRLSLCNVTVKMCSQVIWHQSSYCESLLCRTDIIPLVHLKVPSLVPGPAAQKENRNIRKDIMG